MRRVAGFGVSKERPTGDIPAGPRAPLKPGGASRRGIVLGIALALLVVAAFQPALDGAFIDFDDDVYVTANPQVRAGLTARGGLWALGSVGYGANWHPLAWLSHMADVEFFGLAPRGHHATSVLIHAAGALLLFAGLRLTTGVLLPSWVAALLFAVHPLRVESVAWISERKDVLSGFFFLAALVLWARYARRPGAARYAAALGAHLLALLSKPMAVSLPVVLLIVDWWPLGRFGRGGPGARRLLLEKLPFAVLSAAVGVVTFIAQQRGGEVVVTQRIGERLALVPVSLAAYLGKLVWPSRLAVYYPTPERLPWFAPLAALLVLAALAAAAWSWRRRRPHVAAGLLWYAATVLPVSGVVQAGDQALADRYTYLPLIGVTLAAVLLVREIVPRPPLRVLAATAVAVGLLLLTRSQAGRWQDTVTLFRHAVTVVDGNWLAYNNLGQALLDSGRPEEAVPLLRRALQLRPNQPLCRYNLAAALYKLGNRAEAEEQYRRALAADPEFLAARYNLGVTLLTAGRTDAALAEFDRVLSRQPSHAGARNNRGLALLRRGDTRGAREDFEAAVRSEPGLDKAWHNLGVALEAERRYAEAEASYSRALALEPKKAEARLGRDRVRALQGLR